MSQQLADIALSTVLPGSIASDAQVQAAASAIGLQLTDVTGEIGLVYLFSRIDTLEGDLLEHLGYQFHITGIEGWRLARTDEEKRNLIRTAIAVHRKKGTKFAIERVLSLLNMKGTVTEWFEYGGNPYTFTVDIDVVCYPIDVEVLLLFDQLVNEYKSARSHYETKLNLAQRSKVYVPAWMQAGDVVALYPDIVGDLETVSRAYHAQGVHTWEKTYVFPVLAESLDAGTTPVYSGGIASYVDTMTIYPQEG